jgi:hypothetical protein
MPSFWQTSPLLQGDIASVFRKESLPSAGTFALELGDAAPAQEYALEPAFT